MNTKNGDNFTKIHFGYRVVVVSVFAIVSVILLGLCCKMITRNKAETDRAFEDYYLAVENKLDSFQKVSDALFANSDVRNFSNSLSGQYDAYMVIPVSKMIDVLQTFFTDGECRIILTNLENDICASDNGSIRLDDVRAELMLNDAAINTMKNNHQDNEFYVYNREQGIINFVFRHQYSDRSDNIYCLITTDANVFLPHEDFVIAGQGSRFMNKAGNTGFLPIRKTFIKESASIPGLVYKYSAKYDNIFLIVFLIICIILCGAGIFYSEKLAGQILNVTYMPLIRAAQTTAAEDEPLQELDTWDKAAKKLICDSGIMRSSLMENKIFRKKTYLRNLLYDIEDYQEKYLEEYDLKYLSAESRVILMDFASKNDYTAMRGRIYDEEFESKLEGQLSRNIFGELISVNEGRYVYITSLCDRDILRKKLTDVLEFASACGVDALIAVGDRVENIKNIKSSFRNALECMERKNVFPSHFIAFSSELTNELSSFYYPIDVEVQLIDNILVGNQEAVDEILSKVLARNLYEISLTAEKMRELKIVMVGTINRAINRMNKEASDIFGETSSVYLEIGASRNKEEFAKSIRSVFGMLCSHNEGGNESKQDKIARDIMTYIEANFRDSDLSLERIAKTFFISQNHVSRVLKSKIGKSYKEYLNDVRINEAKRLLKNTPMTVLNVAGNVGYTDIRAFNRLFKKYTNQTPNEYRVTT